MTISVISLVVLAAVVAVGFIKKVNLGFFAMGAAFVLGLAGGMSASEIADGFNSSMFVTLVGVTFLFGMASNNGTLDLFSKKVVALVGRHTVFIPILMFVLSAFISAIGPGHIAAGVLVLLGAVDEKKAIKTIPWGTLILICGMGVLVNVIHTLGGITLISDFLTSFMSEGTATPILAATSGILSWVSSTTGVLMPTMYPIAASVCETFGSGVSYVELISAITATSFAAAISPLSTGGAIIMSSYSAARETITEEMNRMFRTLFLLSVGNVFINVVMAALGVFNLGGLFY